MDVHRSVIRAVVTFAVAMSLGLPTVAQQTVGMDGPVQADAQKQLRGKPFRGIQVGVSNGVATLTGTVDRLQAKLEAEKRLQHLHEISSIIDQVKVSGPDVPDPELFTKLGKQLAFDREGYGTLPFNSIGLEVHDGVVTLSGEVVEPADKESALGLVTNAPGVKGLIDHLQVAPVSPEDWRIRHQVYQAVYGASQLTQYAINPGKPIRIVVVNGRVTLTGVVDNQGDREIAGLRANQVPGVFAVTNDLQVAGGATER